MPHTQAFIIRGKKWGVMYEECSIGKMIPFIYATCNSQSSLCYQSIDLERDKQGTFQHLLEMYGSTFLKNY